jgi:hypothetical protein
MSEDQITPADDVDPDLAADDPALPAPIEDDANDVDLIDATPDSPEEIEDPALAAHNVHPEAGSVYLPRNASFAQPSA